MKVARFFAVLVVLCLAVGCSDTRTTTPAPIPPTVDTTPAGSEFFGGTLVQQGTSFFTFTVTTAGRVDVTLTSLRTSTTTPVTDVAVGLGLGVPSADGASCVVSVSAVVTPSLTTQLTTQAPAGANCVQVSDVGNVVVPLTFVVRVAHS
jgi:hypothetical protein